MLEDFSIEIKIIIEIKKWYKVQQYEKMKWKIKTNISMQLESQNFSSVFYEKILRK